MRDKATRKLIFDAMVKAVRRELGRSAAPQIAELKELLDATEAMFDIGVGVPRRTGTELRRYNPSDEMVVLEDAKARFLASLIESGTTLHLSTEAASIGALVESALNAARWDNHQASVAEYNAGYETLLYQPMVEFKTFTPFQIADTMWLEWQSTSPIAAAGRLQISQKPFPANAGGDPLSWDGVVASVLLPQQGQFQLVWSALGLSSSGKGKLKNPHGQSAPDFYLRVVPLAATIPPVPAAAPSNTLEAYRTLPPPPPVKIIPPDPEAGVGKGGLARPLALRVDFECLSCIESNETADEPYLMAMGCASRVGSWDVWWPKPLFTGVTGTGGNWCPVAITPVGPNEMPYVVSPDEVVGFNVALWEEDNSNSDQVRAIWGKLGQYSAGAITFFLTQDMDKARLASEYGEKVGDIAAEIYELADRDDFIGHHAVLWTYDELVSRFWISWNSHSKAVHEGLQGFSKPWLHPEYQEYFEIGNHLDFAGEDAKYRLYYSAKLINPFYIGPYKHAWNP